ncbi:hypothetical protein DSOL_1454 [Desulfosporosinus metallidurans]|uniref:Uncharacterized protein n=1 Tax=Desulfosporosinus metallidurans TaxID=1888891 RepID=A0A1Q8QZC5_9FIRM|nr:hypothetical protein DSOL_1454 [Desulfosporosinus metallidurans]
MVQGFKFLSNLLPKVARTAEKMLLISTTIGTAIEDVTSATCKQLVR